MKAKNGFQMFSERCEDWAINILMLIAVCCAPVLTTIKILGCIGLVIVALLCMVAILIKILPIVFSVLFIGVIVGTACVAAYAIVCAIILVIGGISFVLDILWDEIKDWRYIAKIVSAF